MTGCGLLAINADRRNQAWHVHYRDGWEAIDRSDYVAAEKHLLAALAEAEHFEPTDRRLAETLDDLGLVYYRLQDTPAAEQMQGRAVAELLLAKGPGDADVPVFLARLGYIYSRQGREKQFEELKEKPYTVFEMGYLPRDARLAARLDSLVVEYQRIENAEAQQYLSGLAHTIRAQWFFW